MICVALGAALRQGQLLLSCRLSRKGRPQGCNVFTSPGKSLVSGSQAPEGLGRLQSILS